MQTHFYTYLYTDPKTNMVRYVGKGCKLRAHIHLKRSPNQRLNNLVKKRIIEGYTVQPTIRFHSTETEAFADERALIKTFGREDLGTGTLFNYTDGGEGASGAIRTAEHCLKISLATKGKKKGPHSDEWKAKVSAANKGRKLTEEHKLKISVAARNRLPITDEVRTKLSAVHLGKRPSEETRKKMSEAQRLRHELVGRPITTPETRAKLSAIRKGKPWTQARRDAQRKKENYHSFN